MPYKFKIARISRSIKVEHVPDLITVLAKQVKLIKYTINTLDNA